MRKPRIGHRLGAGLLAGAMLGLLSPGAFAQNQAVISGRVTSDRGDPIAGATVVVNQTNFGAPTNANGVYSITIGAAAVRGQTVTLTARALGFRATVREVTLSLGTQEQNFTLAADPLRLDELVVTGVSEATSTKKLTFSVGRVSDDQLNIAPAVTPLGALQGKVAGVSVFAANGAPGTAPQLKLRGATSISGSQNPLIIVDGAITNYSLTDIAAEDIERVEVVKGAAASSLYGSSGANGVIQIFTKRGANLAEGKVQVTTRFEGGTSYISRRPRVSTHHPYVVDANGDFIRRPDGARIFPEACDPVDDGPLIPGGCPARAVNIQDQNYPSDAGAQDLLYSSGVFWTAYAAVGQNRGRTNFQASFQHTNNEGSVFNVKGLKRENYRLNLDQVVSDRIDLSLNAFYGRSTNDEPSTGGDGGPFFSIAFLEPHVDPTAGCIESSDPVSALPSGWTTDGKVACPPLQDIGSQNLGANPDGTPYNAFIRDKRSNAANPLYDLYNVNRDRGRSRFSGGGRLRFRPTSWLSAEGSYYYDQLTSELIIAEPVSYWGPTGAASFGGYSREVLNNRSYNAGLTATGSWRLQGAGLFQNLGVTLKGAYIYEDQEDHRLTATATKYVVPRVPEFPGTDPSNQRADSRDEVIRTRDVFGIATLDFDEKVVLDGLVRRDGSSLFGPDARWATYWRASGAVRVPQLLGWTGGPEEFRLRASYGTAGLRPQFDAQYEVLTPLGGTFIKNQIGNRNLRPAQSEELEIGTNLELANGRLTIEYNYSDKETRDQLIRAPLLATTGFTSQWRNVGALEAKTHEVAIGWQAINTRDVALQLNLTGDRVRETITDWPLPDQVYGSLGSFGSFTFLPGVRWGTMRGQRWVRTLEQLATTKAALNETFDPADYSVNFDGYVVLTANRGTGAEQPIQLFECITFDTADPSSCAKSSNIFTIGVAGPDFRVALNTTFAFKRFAISGLLDWSQGGDIYNGTAHWATQDCIDIKCDQSAKPADQRIAEAFYTGGLYNGAASNEAYVEDATFVKLREVTLNYTFNRNELSKVGLGRLFNEIRVGVIGRNLALWTDFTGIDPEVAPEFDDAFKGRANWFQYPPFRTFTGFIEIAF
jgi:TonB-linked SusC/RagA family outer membrane protein